MIHEVCDKRGGKAPFVARQSSAVSRTDDGEGVGARPGFILDNEFVVGRRRRPRGAENPNADIAIAVLRRRRRLLKDRAQRPRTKVTEPGDADFVDAHESDALRAEVDAFLFAFCA